MIKVIKMHVKIINFMFLLFIAYWFIRVKQG